MKKEIEKLVNSKRGTFVINNISYLDRVNDVIDGKKIDTLSIKFKSINGVNFSCQNIIHSRDYDGIINECEKYTKRFYYLCCEELIRNMRNGYRNSTTL
jgi:hypothetical protein